MSYEQVDYETILRHAAGNLKVEGRYNQAGILNDAADTIAALRAKLERAEAEHKELRKAFMFFGSHQNCKNPFAKKCECGLNEIRQHYGDEQRAEQDAK